MQGKKGTVERTEFVTMRVTPKEKRALTTLAKLAGVSVTGLILGYILGDLVFPDGAWDDVEQALKVFDQQEEGKPTNE